MHGKGHGSSCRYSLQLKNLEQRRLKSQSAIPKPSGDMTRDDFIENHHEKSIALRLQSRLRCDPIEKPMRTGTGRATARWAFGPSEQSLA